MQPDDSSNEHEPDRLLTPSEELEPAAAGPSNPTSADEDEAVFRPPDAAALELAMRRLSMLAAKIRSAAAKPSEKQLVLMIHQHIVDDEYSLALKDAVAILAVRKQVSWTTSNGALPAVVKIVAPHVADRRTHSLANVLRMIMGMTLGEAEARITKTGGVDRMARLEAKERDRLREKWERQLPHIRGGRIIADEPL